MISTQLPSLNDFKTLPDEQVTYFRKNGHVHIQGVLSRDEVAAWREEIVRAAYEFNQETRKLEERDTYGKAFLQIMNLWESDESVRNYVMAKRFGKIAADLLGVDNVRLYHDQALFKEPGGGPTPWHQDQYYWPVDTSNTITMWMPLMDIPVEMGMLTFASGSHTSGAVENVPISDESDMLFDKFVKEKNFPVTRPGSMAAGDASFHYGWTLHCAPGNASKDITREVMTIIYVADGARVTEPKNPNQEADRQRWLCGLPPGETVASKLNPKILV